MLSLKILVLGILFHLSDTLLQAISVCDVVEPKHGHVQEGEAQPGISDWGTMLQNNASEP
jgi:hypothetical protein